jgi:predicted nicotinamide N-methyase
MGTSQARIGGGGLHDAWMPSARRGLAHEPMLGPSRRERLKLEYRLARRFTFAKFPVQLKHHQLELTGLADADQVFWTQDRDHASEIRPEDQPYWAQIWPSSYVVAEAIEALDLTGQDVLDLGCGLGLVGAVAAIRGGRVVLADAVPDALLFARLNSWTWEDRVATRLLDWRRGPSLGRRFHLILGADILYDNDDWPHLDRFWRTHLLGGGEVILGEPNRIGSESFALWIAERGWKLTTTVLSHPSLQWPLRLLRLRLPASH